MAGAVSELRARFSAQMNSFRSSVSGVRNEISGIGDQSQQATSQANRAFDGMRSSLASLRSALNNAGAGSSDMFDGLEGSIQRAESDLGNFGRLSVSTMLELQRAVNRANSTLNNLGDDVDLGGLDTEIQNMDQAIQDFGHNATGSTREADKALNNLKTTMTRITAVGAAVGAAVGGGIVAAITITEDYQRALNGVAAQTGATKEETAKMGEAMKNIYANNYGESFQEIGDTLAYASKTTGVLGEDLQYLAQDALMLRDTFGYDMTESVRSADKLMKQFGLTSGDAMGILATGSQKGLDYAQDLLPTIDEYSVYFKQAGFDAEGMFGVFENAKKAGVFNLDYAADGIKEFGIIMTENSDRANLALRSIGITNDKELREKFAKGGESAREAMQQVATALNNVKDPQKQTIAGVELFGTKFEDMGAKAVMEMFKVNTSIKANTDTLKQIDKVKYNTVTEALQGLGRSLQVEVIEPIQTKVMPTINSMINKLKQNLPTIKEAFSTAFNAIIDTVNKFKPTFESLFTIFKNVGGWLASTLVVAFTALGTALAPIVNTITSIVAKFTEWEGFLPILNGIVAGFLAYKTYVLAMQVPMLLQIARTKALMIATRLLNITMAMNPIGLIIALLVGLGVALYTAYKKSETFRNIVNGAWSAIKAGAMAVFNWLVTNIPIWIDNLIAGWNSFKTMLSNLWSGIVSGAKAAWSGLISFFTGIITGIKTAWNGIKSFFTTLWSGIVSIVMPIVNGFINMIKTGFTNFVNNFKYILEPIKTFIVNTWNNIKLLVLSIIGVFLNLITGNFEGLKISLLGIWVAIQRQITNVVTTIKEVAIRIFNVWINGVKTIFNGLKSFLSGLWNGIKTLVVNAVNGLKSGAINGVNALKNGAISAFNALKSGAVNSVNALKNGVMNTINAVKSGFTSAVNGIKNAVSSGFNAARNAASNAVSGMKTAVSNGISAIKNFFTGMKSSIVSTVKGINLTDIGKNIVQGLINGIKGMIGKVASTVSNLAKTVTGKIKGMLKIKSPSRIMREFGGYVGEGLAIGIDKSRKLVAGASQMLAESAMIEPDVNGIGSLTGETIASQVPDEPRGSGNTGSGVTTNYQAPLMQVDNLYVNDETDAREVSNGIYRLQVDHDRARGRSKT